VSDVVSVALRVAKVGDYIWVKCIGIDDKGRVKVSRKAAMKFLVNYAMRMTGVLKKNSVMEL
jgi:predicted RNA-binding protein with RPS1 domain